MTRRDRNTKQTGQSADRRHGTSPDSAAPDALAAVRELEESIAARRVAIEGSRTALRQAEAEAEQILTEARRRAAADAHQTRQQILARARANASALERQADTDLAHLAAAAETERARWVQTAMDAVLGRVEAAAVLDEDAQSGGAA